MTTQLTIVTAVLDGHRPALDAAIASLRNGDADPSSPFAAVAGTHNARFVTISTEADTTHPRRAGGLPSPMFVCSATIDGDPRKWLAALLDALGPTADELWSHCAGWAAAGDRVAFLLDHRMHSELEFRTWEAPAERVVRAVAARDAAADLAVRAQHLSPDELVAEYRKAFPR